MPPFHSSSGSLNRLRFYVIRAGQTFAAVAAIFGACVACGDSAQQQDALSTVRVSDVIDGDTIKLSDGSKVRYVLVDTPEITNGKSQCWGKEAYWFNQDLVEGKEVNVQWVEGQTFDRSLAFVSIAGREVNRLLVERGYGRVLYIEPDGKERYREFKELESQAKADRRGLWGACVE